LKDPVLARLTLAHPLIVRLPPTVALILPLLALTSGARAEGQELAPATKVELRHTVVERAAPKQPLSFAATVTNCDTCSVVLYTRTRGRSYFARLPMKATPDGHRVVLDAQETRGDSLHYYIEVKDSANGLVAYSGRADSPHIVVLDPTLKPPPPPPPVPRPKVRASSRRTARSIRRCNIGPQLSYIRYEEPGVMSESGMMWGVSARCKSGGRTHAAVEARFSFGWIDYDGALMTGEPYEVSNNFNTLFEARALVGRRAPASIENLDTYVGVGYRRLFDGLGHDPAGYDRTSQYVYSPIGLRFATQTGKTRVETHAEYRYFWTGRQHSALSDLAPQAPDITNKQRSGYGLSLGMALSTTTARGWRAHIEPYINYWSIDDSDTEFVGHDAQGQPILLHEPKNSSMEVGFNLTVEL
jgi:hypothetical protein